MAEVVEHYPRRAERHRRILDLIDRTLAEYEAAVIEHKLKRVPPCVST